MKKTNKPATLADVARHAGVHVGTASMVLNGATSNTRVAAATRQRIEQSARTLCYASNRVAQGLKRARMECIGLIFPSQPSALTLGNAFSPPLLQGVIETAAELSYNVTHCHKRWRDAATSAAGFLGQGIDGFVVVAPQIDSDIVDGLADLGLPVVVLAAPSTRAEVLSFTIDNAAGVERAVTHLLGLGHRRIAHLVTDDIHFDTHARRTAFLAAMHAAGITGEVRVSSYAEGRFRADALSLLQGNNRPTAVFTTNDAAAFAVAQAARELGLSIPGDLSLVGFDDFPAAAFADPPLTTVRQPLMEMGGAAARALIDAIEGRPVTSRTFAPTLIVRGSTAQPQNLSGKRRERKTRP